MSTRQLEELVASEAAYTGFVQAQAANAQIIQVGPCCGLYLHGHRRMSRVAGIARRCLKAFTEKRELHTETCAHHRQLLQVPLTPSTHSIVEDPGSSSALAQSSRFDAQAPQRRRCRHAQVKAQLRRGNAELARATLAKEGLLGELRNQIAIIRCACPARCLVLHFEVSPGQPMWVMSTCVACCMAVLLVCTCYVCNHQLGGVGLAQQDWARSFACQGKAPLA